MAVRSRDVPVPAGRVAARRRGAMVGGVGVVIVRSQGAGGLVGGDAGRIGAVAAVATVVRVIVAMGAGGAVAVGGGAAWLFPWLGDVMAGRVPPGGRGRGLRGMAPGGGLPRARGGVGGLDAVVVVGRVEFDPAVRVGGAGGAVAAAGGGRAQRGAAGGGADRVWIDDDAFRARAEGEMCTADGESVPVASPGVKLSRR